MVWVLIAEVTLLQSRSVLIMWKMNVRYRTVNLQRIMREERFKRWWNRNNHTTTPPPYLIPLATTVLASTDNRQPNEQSNDAATLSLHSVKTVFQHEKTETLTKGQWVWKEEQCSSKFPMHQIKFSSQSTLFYSIMNCFKFEWCFPDSDWGTVASIWNSKFEFEKWNLLVCRTAHFFSKVLLR